MAEPKKEPLTPEERLRWHEVLDGWPEEVKRMDKEQTARKWEGR